jgi:hypothetical protein
MQHFRACNKRYLKTTRFSPRSITLIKYKDLVPLNLEPRYCGIRKSRKQTQTTLIDEDANKRKAYNAQKQPEMLNDERHDFEEYIQS